MSRSIGSLATMVQATTMTLACCWKVVTQYGATYGFTTCSRDLVIDGITYSANSGMEPTAVECNLGLQVDNSEVLGFINPSVLSADLLRAGYFDAATVYKFLVDYTNPSGSKIKLIWGVMGAVQLNSEVQFTAEMRGGSQWLAADVVPLTQATCRAVFGDAQCKYSVVTANGTITSVASAKQFACSALIGAYADGYFDGGYLIWNSGQNSGLRMDVRHFDQSVGGFLLMSNVVLPIAVGNTFTVRQGCSKTRAACIAKGNILNFDAEPDMPGNDALLRIVRAS